MMSDGEEGCDELLEGEVMPRTWNPGCEEEDVDVEEDPDPHATPERELLWACEHGHVTVVERILKEQPEAVLAKDTDGYTPLHRAAYNDYLHIIKLLLNSGASISARTVDGWTALHSACRWNHYKCALTLIEAGCDINATTNSGQTPLHLAATNPQARQTLQLLLKCRDVKLEENSNGETARDIAVRSGPFGGLFEVTERVLNVYEGPD